VATTNVKVMLDGQGADEMFGGYRTQLASRIRSLLKQQRWSEARRFMRHAARVPGMSIWKLLYQLGATYFPSASVRVLSRFLGIGPPLRWLDAAWCASRGIDGPSVGVSGDRPTLTEELRASFCETSLPRLLRYEDRNSMAFSIESRVPFVTPALVRFAQSLPEEFLITSEGTSKAVLRQAMNGLVPDAILNRRFKVGFGAPERRWMAALSPLIDRAITSGVAREIPALNIKSITDAWQGARCDGGAAPSAMWRVFNLIRWAESWAIDFC